MFSREELVYLRLQQLGRLATVAPDGLPTVDAVGYLFDGKQFFIGGYKLTTSRKYRNIAAGNQQIALIIDDVASVEPWVARGLKLHGTAEIVEGDGYFGPGPYFAITPRVSWSWGIVGPTFVDGRFVTHKIEWTKALATTA
jgi:pyridoxamine 5'-phosphate oxidase family protein